MTGDSAPYNVLLKRGEFVDSVRGGRVVPYKIYYPDGVDEQVPVIVWSHGFGGNADGAGFLARHIAGHGYILVHLTHKGTDSSLWEGQPGHPWDILRKANVPRETTLDRFRDVPFALAELERWARENPEIGDHMDFTRLGISGHSFGALTTQVMAGQKVPGADGKLISFHEPLFRAGILYSPVPISHLSDAPPAEIYGSIAIPLLHMTGTDDDSPLEGFDFEHRLLVHEHSGPEEKYMLIKKGGDHMVYNGTRGKLAVNPLRERHEEIIQRVSLAFWDAYLKDDQSARAWLTGEGIRDYLGSDAEYR